MSKHKITICDGCIHKVTCKYVELCEKIPNESETKLPEPFRYSLTCQNWSPGLGGINYPSFSPFSGYHPVPVFDEDEEVENNG